MIPLPFSLTRVRVSVIRNLVLSISAIFLLLFLFFWLFRDGTPLPSVYRIALDKKWYPPDLSDLAANMQGFSNELLTAIAAKSGITIYLVVSDASSWRAELLEGDYDAVLTSARPMQEQRERILLSEGLYPLGPVLVVREENQTAAFSEMQGQAIGIVGEAFSQLNLENFTDITIRRFSNARQAMLSLDRKRVDGVVIDYLSAYIFVSGSYANKFKIATSPLNDTALRVVVRKGAAGQRLIEQINRGLEAIKSDGTYTELINKWGFSQKSKEENLLLGWEVLYL